MKVFISQPMKGKTQLEILNEKEKSLFKIKDYVFRNFNQDIEIIETYFKDFDGNRLQFLGKSISDGMALCDIAVFLPGWEKADGCRCENFIAIQYGLKILYINE